MSIYHLVYAIHSQYKDLASAEREASVSMLMIKLINFKLIKWTLRQKKKKRKKEGAFGISLLLEGGAKWLRNNIPQTNLNWKKKVKL